MKDAPHVTLPPEIKSIIEDWKLLRCENERPFLSYVIEFTDYHNSDVRRVKLKANQLHNWNRVNILVIEQARTTLPLVLKKHWGAVIETLFSNPIGFAGDS